ncbi:AraC family transcriptional regulator [Nocardioides sp. CFH 31398]|uniref:helix-turn-helix domain-containing protein n=1 Tax=Nocardioides sp. CFH 31398 TaxID=2919579 RepID=UPI001F06E897|nr:helix-turn-helix domain-containing protein [Nocardioides sp. CFH 31398]MCH1867019.1 helix-turn-helix domain-containing protein [Nocardioides sp. CFH 31398]
MPERLPGLLSLTAYDVVGEPGVHVGMPSTTLTLVLPYDDPLDVGWAGGPRTVAWSTVAGLHTVPAAIHHGARQAGVQLELSALGARLLLGVPAADLRQQIVTLGDLDAALAILPERLAATPVRDRPALVRDALRRAAARREDAAAARAEVGRSLALLTRGVPVAAVAEDVGFSRRRLQDLVRAEVGVTPKEFARLARFERSRRLVRPGTPLAEVAARCGYADQAHLAREWRALAGLPPSRWLEQEFPNVQAARAGLAAG